MKKEDGHRMTEELLFRHFAGQLDEKLNGEVLSWREQNSENRLEYDRVKFFYLDTKALAHIDQPGKSYDTAEAWEKLRTKNEIEADVRPPNPYLKLVASIVLMIGLGLLMYNHYFNIDEVVLTALEEPIKQELPDGSNITLNKGTELTYPEKFRGRTREVALKGEAYFEVEASKELPFIIHVDGLQVIAVGTAFNVNAIQNSDSIIVSVDEGIVEMLFAEATKTLTAGEIGVFVKGNHVMMTPKKASSKTHNFWRTKKLNFQGSTLNNVLKSIKEHYGAEVQLENAQVGDCKITVTFEEETIENVLDVVAATLNLELVSENGVYLLKGESCNR